MRLIRYLLVIVILLAGISFALLNPGIVTVNYWMGQKTLPFSLLLVAVFVIGWGIGMLMASGFFLAARLESFRLKRRLKLAEKEVRNLRVIPIQDRN